MNEESSGRRPARGGRRRVMGEQARSEPTLVRAERAVLVSVEFAGERRRLTSAASQARKAALLDGAAAGVVAEPAESQADGDAEAERAEFAELACSAGAEVVATLVQRRARPDAATLVGTGKVDELVGMVESSGADVVLFNHDLSPSQMRNLEARMTCRVIDRTQLILDIFARHARTREGQLQVELAQLTYQLPRLAGKGKAMSQLGGGIGTRGPGETKLETDRRRINARMDHLREELEAVRRIRRQQRQRREAVPVPVVALVGYTNAGKSTLFNALTRAAGVVESTKAMERGGVLESSRMFATLDPKLTQVQLPSRRKVLLSDTVGFIRNLPHDLVTSFRATLEEVERAEVLLHVRDASSAMGAEQKVQVEQVLSELDVALKPVIEVLNKVDLLDDAERAVLPGGDGVVFVSAKLAKGLETLLKAIDERLTEDPLVELALRMPQSEGPALAALRAGAVLSEERFDGNLIYFCAVGPASLLGRYRRFAAQASDGRSSLERGDPVRSTPSEAGK